VSDWQLDRLPGDVRQEAENAAQRDGLPLHRWLGKLIRETCADEGIALAHELSPNLVREPVETAPRSIPVPPRSAAEPIRMPKTERFVERPAMPDPPRRPANANDSLATTALRQSEPEEPSFAAEMRRPVEPAPAPAQTPRATEPPRTTPRRFSNVPRMPEPRVAEALHVVEPRPVAPPVEARPAPPAVEPRAGVSPRPAIRVAPTAREAIARDIAAVRSAALARGAEAPSASTASPARERAFSASPVSPLSTATATATQSPESSQSTTGESWSARRARQAATGRYTAPRRSAAGDAAAAPSRSAREPIAASAPAASSAFAAVREDRSMLMAKLVEGLRRNELSAVGEARLFLKLMTEHMASIGDITAATGRTPDQVARSLRLLGLSDRLRDLIDRGALSREQAFALLDADPPPPNPAPPSSGYRMP
jgi:hypothetical protein